MAIDLIHDRGRGPEIAGTRLTVYNLLPYFLDSTATEDYIRRLYELTPEQVAAARAFVLNNLETVLGEHLKIEARIAAENSAQDGEGADRTHAVLLRFRRWLDERAAETGAVETSAAKTSAGASGSARSTRSRELPSFRQWVAEQSSRSPGHR